MTRTFCAGEAQPTRKAIDEKPIVVATIRLKAGALRFMGFLGAVGAAHGDSTVAAYQSKAVAIAGPLPAAAAYRIADGDVADAIDELADSFDRFLRAMERDARCHRRQGDRVGESALDKRDGGPGGDGLPNGLPLTAGGSPPLNGEMCDGGEKDGQLCRGLTRLC